MLTFKRKSNKTIIELLRKAKRLFGIYKMNMLQISVNHRTGSFSKSVTSYKNCPISKWMGKQKSPCPGLPGYHSRKPSRPNQCGPMYTSRAKHRPTSCVQKLICTNRRIPHGKKHPVKNLKRKSGQQTHCYYQTKYSMHWCDMIK